MCFLYVIYNMYWKVSGPLFFLIHFQRNAITIAWVSDGPHRQEGMAAFVPRAKNVATILQAWVSQCHNCNTVDGKNPTWDV